MHDSVQFEYVDVPIWPQFELKLELELGLRIYLNADLLLMLDK